MLGVLQDLRLCGASCCLWTVSTAKEGGEGRMNGLWRIRHHEIRESTSSDERSVGEGSLSALVKMWMSL